MSNRSEGSAKRRQERGTVPSGNVSGGRNAREQRASGSALARISHRFSPTDAGMRGQVADSKRNGRREGVVGVENSL